MIQLEQEETVTNWRNKQTLENRTLPCYTGFAFDKLHELGQVTLTDSCQTNEFMCHRYSPLDWQRPSYQKMPCPFKKWSYYN